MNITLDIEICKEEIATFSTLEKEVFKFVTDIGCQIISRILEEQDEVLRGARDRGRYRCKGKRKTSVKTRLGVVEYRRNVYQDRQSDEGKECVYLLDEQLALNTVGLISTEVCLQAIQSVCEGSYRARFRLNLVAGLTTEECFEVLKHYDKSVSKRPEKALATFLNAKYIRVD